MALLIAMKPSQTFIAREIAALCEWMGTRNYQFIKKNKKQVSSIYKVTFA